MISLVGMAGQLLSFPKPLAARAVTHERVAILMTLEEQYYEELREVHNDLRAGARLETNLPIPALPTKKARLNNSSRAE